VGHDILQTALLHVSGHTECYAKKHMATSSVKNNRTQTRETVNQFFIAEGQILANPK